MAPKGKARPRAVVRRGKGGKVRAGTHTSEDYAAWKYEAAARLGRLLSLAGWVKAADPRRDAVRVSVTAYHPRPKTPPDWMSGKEPERVAERAAFRAGWSPLRLATPDADNMVGAVLDALSDTKRCWHDDTQAILGAVASRWAAAGEEPHLVIELERVPWELPTPLRNGEMRT